jgi:hypothetical protein
MHQQFSAKGKREEPTQLAQRIQRGLSLYSEKGQEIVWLAEDRCFVPSRTHEGRRYLVVFGEDGERCNCADRTGDRLGTCLHRIAALVSRAKRPVYEVRKTHDSRRQAEVFILIERRAGAEREIDRGPVAQMYEEKWSREEVA